MFRPSRRAFVLRAGQLAAGSLALSARGSEAASGWLARGVEPPPTSAAPIRLDSNENPVGPPPEVLDAISTAFRDAGRYPRFTGQGLLQDLAQLHGTTAECVAVGCGSIEILRMAVDAFTTQTRGLVAGTPTYESPAGRARLLGRPLVEVPVDSRSLQLDLDSMADKARDAGLVFICNPNNPTGVLHGAKAIAAFVARVRRSAPEAHILIDEAYHDYVSDASYESAVPLALSDTNVIVSRTFSKAYGMAGIRLGYAVGRPETVRALGAWRLGFGVSVLAAAAGRAAIAARRSIDAERARNAAAREFTARVFGDLGFTPLASHTNFVFVDLRRDVRSFQQACRDQGVLVGRQFPPLDTWARVSIGTMDEMRRAADVFRSVLAAAPSAAAVD